VMVENGTTDDHPGVEIRVAPDPDSLAEAAAAVFLACAMGTPENRDLSVALSGGRTPEAMYRLLSKPPLRDAIRWNRTKIFFVDERCVPADHVNSNYRMVRENLLSQVPIEPRRIYRMRGEEGPVGGAESYEAEMKEAIPVSGGEEPRLDLVFLGLGADGHTASIFPGTPAVGENSRLVCAGYNQRLNSDRITLSPRSINAARLVVFLVAGQDKADVVRRLLEEEGEPRDLPARIVRPTDGAVLWLMDSAASSGLSRRQEFVKV
jgi:6-phosphogluconolactonase